MANLNPFASVAAPQGVGLQVQQFPQAPTQGVPQPTGGAFGQFAQQPTTPFAAGSQQPAQQQFYGQPAPQQQLFVPVGAPPGTAPVAANAVTRGGRPALLSKNYGWSENKVKKIMDAENEMLRELAAGRQPNGVFNVYIKLREPELDNNNKLKGTGRRALTRLGFERILVSDMTKKKIRYVNGQPIEEEIDSGKGPDVVFLDTVEYRGQTIRLRLNGHWHQVSAVLRVLFNLSQDDADALIHRYAYGLHNLFVYQENPEGVDYSANSQFVRAISAKGIANAGNAMVTYVASHRFTDADLPLLRQILANFVTAVDNDKRLKQNEDAMYEQFSLPLNISIFIKASSRLTYFPIIDANGHPVKVRGLSNARKHETPTSALDKITVGRDPRKVIIDDKKGSLTAKLQPQRPNSTGERNRSNVKFPIDSWKGVNVSNRVFVGTYTAAQKAIDDFVLNNAMTSAQGAQILGQVRNNFAALNAKIPGRKTRRELNILPVIDLDGKTGGYSVPSGLQGPQVQGGFGFGTPFNSGTVQGAGAPQELPIEAGELELP